jgi:amino acid transporter
MEELASALPMSGAPYTYLYVCSIFLNGTCDSPVIRLNVSTKTFALVGATLMLLDFAATAVVSSAAAAVYLSSEVHSLPFPTWMGAVIVLILFTTISLLGVRESTRVAFAVLSVHVCNCVGALGSHSDLFLRYKLLSMIILIIASSVYWGQTGLGQLKTNWKIGRTQTSGDSAVAKQLFYGICLGMLGLTGFECNFE